MSNQTDKYPKTYLTEALATKEETRNWQVNVLAIIFYIIGILAILAGFFVTGYQLIQANFNWLPTLYWLASGIFAGMIFIGFGEIIRLLARINNRLP